MGSFFNFDIVLRFMCFHVCLFKQLGRSCWIVVFFSFSRAAFLSLYICLSFSKSTLARTPNEIHPSIHSVCIPSFYLFIPFFIQSAPPLLPARHTNKTDSGRMSVFALLDSENWEHTRKSARTAFNSLTNRRRLRLFSHHPETIPTICFAFECCDIPKNNRGGCVFSACCDGWEREKMNGEVYKDLASISIHSEIAGLGREGRRSSENKINTAHTTEWYVCDGIAGNKTRQIKANCENIKILCKWNVQRS